MVIPHATRYSPHTLPLTVCTQHNLPLAPCDRCNDPGKVFAPATMYSGPKGTKSGAPGSGLAERANMLARGEEHGFSLK